MLSGTQFSGLRFKFSPEEDEILKDIVMNNQFESWTHIATLFNQRSAQLSLNTPVARNERQCRDRWFNFLAPDVNRTPWTAEEDTILMSKYMEFGPRWSLISRFLKGRKDNMIKNRIKLLTRRQNAVKNDHNKEGKQRPHKIENSYDEGESIFNFDFNNVCFMEIN